MTYDQLLQNGAPEGSLVTLTGVRYCTKGVGRPGELECLPAYSARLPGEPQPGELSLILVIRDKRIMGEMWSAPGRSEFTGEVYKGADRMEDWAKQDVERAYPGIQLARCWLLDGSLHDQAVRQVSPMIWSAVVLVLGACVTFGCWARIRTAAKNVHRSSTESSSTSK
jgi:hypothetical protein